VSPPEAEGLKTAPRAIVSAPGKDFDVVAKSKNQGKKHSM
jgi:hypothetical protein